MTYFKIAIIFISVLLTSCSGSKKPTAETSDSSTAMKMPEDKLVKVKIGNSIDDKKQISEDEKLLTHQVFTVMGKTGMPASNDKHDYLSLAPYFWPDPSRKDGMPYMRKDGEVNPETRNHFTDFNEWNELTDAVGTLCKAYGLSGEKKYLVQTSNFIKAWFIAPATRMNPNLDYAQGVRGVNNGRQFGIIEFGGIAEILMAMQQLQNAGEADAAFTSAFKNWLQDYAGCLQTSKLGKLEAGASNNHGTTYDAQLSNILIYLGEIPELMKLLEQVKIKRIATQIEPDGKQSEELSRTRAFSYSILNLNGLTQLAILGKKYGVDIWGFETADGRSIKKACDFLIPYLNKSWDYDQIAAMDASREKLVAMLKKVGREFGEEKYEVIAEKYKK
ncbi:MAG: alginate lyase family protein [Chitinophagaceae bacterium]